MSLDVLPLVAGAAYFSGLEPGCGHLYIPANGIPLEISELMTTASPGKRRSHTFDKPINR